MCKLVLSLAFTLGLCSLIHAQDVPRAEVFGGYSYLNFETNGLTSSRQNANGWEAGVSVNFNRMFGIEADVNGYYKGFDLDLSPYDPSLGVVHANFSDYSYLAGSRVKFGPVFVHGLLGGDHLTGSTLGGSRSQDSFAGAFGGGAEWKIYRNLSLRPSADYVFSRHNILGALLGVSLPALTQNNFRIGIGCTPRK